MTILPCHRYRDPLEVLLEDEAHTCKGCAHIELHVMFGEQVEVCGKSRRVGNRCKHYEEMNHGAV